MKEGAPRLSAPMSQRFDLPPLKSTLRWTSLSLWLCALLTLSAPCAIAEPIEPPPAEPAAAEPAAVEPAAAEPTAPAAKPLNWELSFGTTQLFEGWFGESELNLPVSSATLMLARALGERFHLWAIFNLPLVPSQEVQADGSARLTRSAPVFLFGGSVVLFTEKVSKKNRLSADLGLWGGKVLRRGGPYFPLSALRLKILKGEDTTLYLGLSASVGVDTLGLIYGVGHRF